ncbi:MAG: hypothetical protein JWO84_458 [Parcubacteria group bacterium]|nr:hypothetical protein [Parcubacteria group bacterium]
MIDQYALQISTLATTAASHSWALVSNFLILLVLTVLFILFSYRSRGGILSLILGFYVGYALYLVFPYTSMVLGFGTTPLLKAILSVLMYLVACVIPFLFVERIVSGGYGVLSVLPRFGLSFLAATFLLALAYHVFHVSNIYTFPEPMNTLFAPDQYFFLWFIAPLVGLLLLVH